MTNKIETVYSAITDKLHTAGIANVLRIPDEIQSIGNYYPMALLKEGVQTYTIDGGQRHFYQLQFFIYICLDMYGGSSKAINDLQATVFNELFKNSTLDGVAMNVNPVSVDPEPTSPLANFANLSGGMEQVTMRMIEMTLTLQDIRY